jgi:hypothetical protein
MTDGHGLVTSLHGNSYLKELTSPSTVPSRQQRIVIASKSQTL